MTNEFLELGPKKHTYKISGGTCSSRELRYVIGTLNLIEEVIPTSIKVYGVLDCQFKFKGTEKALRNLLSELNIKLDFKVRRVKKVLF